MVPMLILDKQLTMDRMVSVASRPRIPEAFRRTEPAIEAILVPAAAGGVPQRRLAGVLVLAGSRGVGPAPVPEAPGPQEPPTRIEETPDDTALPYVPPILLPELHCLTDASSGEAKGAVSLLRRFVRLFRAAPRAPSPASAAQGVFPHLDARRIHAWHAGPIDVS
jgi:hypothetical protein